MIEGWTDPRGPKRSTFFGYVGMDIMYINPNLFTNITAVTFVNPQLLWMFETYTCNVATRQLML